MEDPAPTPVDASAPVTQRAEQERGQIRFTARGRAVKRSSRSSFGSRRESCTLSPFSTYLRTHRLAVLAIFPIVIGVVLWLVHQAVGHYLLALAYRGTSPIPFLNTAITGQALHPLSHYTDYADGIVLRVLITIMALAYGALGCGLLTPAFSESRRSLTRRARFILPPAVLCFGIGLLLVVVWVHAQYATNVPYHDDYHTSLDLVIRYEDAESFRERSAVLLRRHAAHLTLVSNLANVLDWSIFGSLDFRRLVLLGFAFLVAMISLLAMHFKGRNRDLHCLLVALLCANCLTQGAGLWPLASLQNFPVLALIGGALWLLSQGRHLPCAVAALLVALATFTSGNGVLGFAAGVAVLVFRRATKWALLAWLSWAVLVIGAYFHLRGGSGLLSGVHQGGVKLSMYYLTFLGSMAQVLPVFGGRLAPFLGGGIIGVTIWLAAKGYHRRNPHIAGWILFMLMTAGIVTLVRCGNPFGPPLVSRYAINSCATVGLLYVAAVDVFNIHFTRLRTSLLCSIALLFNLLCMQHSLPKMANRQVRLARGALRYAVRADTSALISRNPSRADALLREAANRGIYDIAGALAWERQPRPEGAAKPLRQQRDLDLQTDQIPNKRIERDSVGAAVHGGPNGAVHP